VTVPSQKYIIHDGRFAEQESIVTEPNILTEKEHPNKWRRIEFRSGTSNLFT
jgi:hypothetical protein